MEPLSLPRSPPNGFANGVWQALYEFCAPICERNGLYPRNGDSSIVRLHRGPVNTVCNFLMFRRPNLSLDSGEGPPVILWIRRFLDRENLAKLPCFRQAAL